MGDPSEILVAVPPAVWLELEVDLKSALEPRTFTVRSERVFDVGHTDPSGPNWAALRLVRQILLIGSADESPIAEAIAANSGEAPEAPAVFQVRNVWARNQLVTILLTPDAASRQVVSSLLPSLRDVYLRQFQEYVEARMFVTGENEELLDSLRSNAGFTLLLPRVYRAEEPEPGVYRFRNDQPDASQLIRNITVASQPAGAIPATAEAAGAWRAELATRLTFPPQVTDSIGVAVRLETEGQSGLQIQGIWSNPPGEWPAAGPFFTRLIDCPDRTFLVDAWLYAPGDAKYEYVFQLSTILDSFRCGAVAR
jgi:hypothetical protein